MHAQTCMRRHAQAYTLRMHVQTRPGVHTAYASTATQCRAQHLRDGGTLRRATTPFTVCNYRGGGEGGGAGGGAGGSEGGRGYMRRSTHPDTLLPALEPPLRRLALRPLAVACGGCTITPCTGRMGGPALPAPDLAEGVAAREGGVATPCRPRLLPRWARRGAAPDWGTGIARCARRQGLGVGWGGLLGDTHTHTAAEDTRIAHTHIQNERQALRFESNVFTLDA
jgi:hypothetical protein